MSHHKVHLVSGLNIRTKLNGIKNFSKCVERAAKHNRIGIYFKKEV